jgi:hypothetical protein
MWFEIASDLMAPVTPGRLPNELESVPGQALHPLGLSLERTAREGVFYQITRPRKKGS